MLQEFKDFINRGNLVEIAVAFVMGVAFASVVSTFTERIVSPLIGLIFDLDSLEGIGTFGDAVTDAGFPVGSVGAFIEALLNFVIVAFVMFLVVKAYNNMKAKEEEAAPSGPSEVELLTEIRDNLVKT